MNGQGPLNIKSDMLDYMLNHYFNPKNKGDRPTHFAITKTGDMIGSSICPSRYAGDCILRPSAALKNCQKNVKKFLKRKERCWVFAKGRKIVWNNLNIEIPKGTPNQQIKEILIAQGFYGSKIIKKEKEKKQIKKKSTTSSSDITKQLTQLKQLLDDGVINQEEFIKAKKKLLN
tara:strand:- start:441 stop:962 length:522 start_codon:yes stop_codon:yes gene_type:complete